VEKKARCIQVKDEDENCVNKDFEGLEKRHEKSLYSMNERRL
jgi:hypothetical protein